MSAVTESHSTISIPTDETGSVRVEISFFITGLKYVPLPDSYLQNTNSSYRF